MDHNQVRKNIVILERLCKGGLAGIRVLITSRPHFQNQSTSMQHITQRLTRNRVSPRIIRLDKIPRHIVYENVKSSLLQDDKISHDLLNKMSRMHDPIGMGEKPLFMQLVKETLRVGLRGCLPKWEIFNEIDLYECYIGYALKPEFLEDPEQETLPDDLKRNLLTLLSKIAWDIHLSKKNFVDLSEYNEQSWASLLWNMIGESEPMPISGKDEYNPSQDACQRVGNRSLLTRVRCGGSHGMPVDFFHRSMREYFVAKRVIHALENADEDAQSIFSSHLFNPEVRYFIAQFIRRSNQSQQKTVEVCLTQLAHECKKGASGANAVSLLNSSGLGLGGEDWSGSFLDDSDLRCADLSGINFTGSSLRSVDLGNANLTRTNFTRCNMEGVRIGLSTRPMSLAIPPSRQSIIASYDDYTVLEWRRGQHNDYSAITMDEPTTAHFSRMFFSPMEDLCAVTDKEFQIFTRLENKLIMQARFPLPTQCRAVDVGSDRLVMVWQKSMDQVYLVEIDLGTKKESLHSTIGSTDGFLYLAGPCIGWAVPLAGNARWILPNRLPCSCTSLKVDMSPHDDADGCSNLSAIAAWNGHASCHLRVAHGYMTGEIEVLEFNNTDVPNHLVARIKCHEGAVTALAFQDKDTLVSGGRDSAIHVHRIHNVPDSHGKLEPIGEPIRLKLQCDGMILDGVHPPNARQFLEKLQLQSNQA